MSCLLCISICGTTQELFALSNPLSYKKIKIYESHLVDTGFPSRAKVKNEKDINYRLSILPEPKDRFMSAYIVVPMKGVIAPVVTEPQSSQRYKDVLAGKQIDFSKDLNKGIFHYPGTPGPQSLGNGVYFAHTSQIKSDKSKYGTIGQAFARLDPKTKYKSGDVFYYYKKLKTHTRALYEYEVISEKRVKDTDITVFHQDKVARVMSVVGCVDWGTARQRRLTKGKLLNAFVLDYSTGKMTSKLVYSSDQSLF